MDTTTSIEDRLTGIAEAVPPTSGRARWAGLAQRVLPPAAIGFVALFAWEAVVRLKAIPPCILPGPLLIGATLLKDWHTLYPSLLVTLAVTGAALLVAPVAGTAIAILFAQWHWVERSFFPYAVILQVTPVVAIAPLIIIWVKNIQLSLLICAWIVAFFPVVSNTTLGLNSTDHHLLELFDLYGASRRQVLWYLRLPGALPYFFGGLRSSGGLARTRSSSGSGARRSRGPRPRGPPRRPRRACASTAARSGRASWISTRIWTRATSGNAPRTPTAPSPPPSAPSRRTAPRAGPPRTSRAAWTSACAAASRTARARSGPISTRSARRPRSAGRLCARSGTGGPGPSSCRQA